MYGTFNRVYRVSSVRIKPHVTCIDFTTKKGSVCGNQGRKSVHEKKYLLEKNWLYIKLFNFMTIKSLHLVTVFAMSKSVTKSRVHCVRKMWY